MALNKYRIGDLITLVDEKNNIGIKKFYGININKEFMPTVANTEGLDETKYKVVRKGRFVFSGMQTGRDGCIRISMYNGEEPILVSPAYTTFEVAAKDVVIPLYFFMKFLSSEMDRYGAFCSDGSIRSNLDWNVFCDIEIELPSIKIQERYVNIYNAMIDNQKKYELGINDLKLICDAAIERLKRNNECIKLEKYIKRVDIRNNDKSITKVKNVSVYKTFNEPTAKVNRNELGNYKVVKPNQIAFVQTTHNEHVFAYALNDFDYDVVVSSVDEVFETDTDKLLPHYLCLFFNRSEFDRYARFNSWGSARETFTWEDLKNVAIPIPSIEVQNNLANIFKSYNMRKKINDRLKKQIKNVCPILIKGSIKEGSADNEKFR